MKVLLTVEVRAEVPDDWDLDMLWYMRGEKYYIARLGTPSLRSETKISDIRTVEVEKVK